jgi:hypothetical protein
MMGHVAMTCSEIIAKVRNPPPDAPIEARMIDDQSCDLNGSDEHRHRDRRQRHGEVVP